ncbi:macro domain-containing protein [Legionella spiritensis]|uniref:macro domain-containing protein n=1 Tax=Legionella spiritensis TaxID=452 RepID=UPI000F709A73|nr:macro domain-containing protein [Legionella spiritensis]VEG92133.1 O-acetyl-ADP-ribose deacetylase [Legionella spiritensis]
MELKKNTSIIELKKGDITKQNDIDAIVNAANAELKTGGGVAGAIHRGAGPKLEAACRPLAPIKPGDAVITAAFELPNQYVIHCLGPVYGRDKPEAELLENCYSNALGVAEDNKIESIAFPSISTGAFSYPVEEAAKVALTAVTKKMDSLTSVKRIWFILHSDKDLEIYQRQLQKISDGQE